MKKKNIKVTIIGMGRFGKFLKETLIKHFPDLLIVNTLGEADIVFPCVPISAFKEVIEDISPNLKENALVIDVCSVKVFPVQVMKEILPEKVQILATHPLFGPDSAKEGLTDLPIVVCPIRIDKNSFIHIKKVLEKLGLRVHIMSPEEHDSLVAFTQTYTHLIGRIGQDIGIKPTLIDTKGFQRLFSVQEQVVNDTQQLFLDMNRFNPFAADMRIAVMQSILKIEAELASLKKGDTITP